VILILSAKEIKQTLDCFVSPYVLQTQKQSRRVLVENVIIIRLGSLIFFIWDYSP